MKIKTVQDYHRVEKIENWYDYLTKGWSAYLYNKIRKKSGSLYGIGFYYKKTIQNKEWIKKDPCSSSIRLRNACRCVYCGEKLDVLFGVGDHIVGHELDSALWIVPCCRKCNSSKGNRDLLYWWCIMKKRNILTLKKDVFAVYIRAKHKLLEKKNQLYEKPSQEYIDILNSLEGLSFE